MYIRVVLTVKNPLKSSQMKTIFKSAMLLASALVVFSSCLKEQTALSIEDIPGSAKVMGILTYNKGQAYEGGKFIELKEVAAGVEVIVKVHNKTLSPNGNATGTTDYATTTKEDGSFEVIVPAVDGGVSYEIFAPSFQDTYKSLSERSWKDGEPVFDESEGVYELSKTGSMTLKPGSVAVENAVYTFPPFAQEKSLPTYVTLIVEAGIGVCVEEKVLVNQTTNESKKIPGAALEYAEGVDVVVKVTYGPDYDNQVRYYGGTTGSKGTFELQIPATSEDMSADIQLMAREFIGEDDFVYYTYNDDRTGTKEHEITAGGYTFLQHSTSGCGLRSFEFFTPVASVTMQVGTVVTGADEDKLYFTSYYDFNWASKWTADKLGVEEEE